VKTFLDWLFDQLYGLWISLFPPREDPGGQPPSD
jgi:hypothetical protein